MIRLSFAVLVAVASVLVPAVMSAQQPVQVARLEADPAAITVGVGDAVPLRVTAYAADGRVVDAPLRFAAPLAGVRVVDEREVVGIGAGEWDITVFVAPEAVPPEAEVPQLRIPVTVTLPPVASVRVEAEPGTLYAGTTVGHRAVALQADGTERPDVRVRWSSSDPDVASVDRFGAVTAHRAGAVTITVEADGAREQLRYEARPFPATRLEIVRPSTDEVRTGDVLDLEARLLDAAGRTSEDVPVTWAYTFEPDDSVGVHAGAGAVLRDGRFVAEVPGRYTIVASAGPLTARHALEVGPRGMVREVRLVGQGRVANVHTSDFWVWRAHDGRDYAITGTWGADGIAYIWDVTDPANIVKTDSIQVDARTVNDVKVSPDGRYATLTREGASDRRNGLVLLDLSDPAHPTVAATYDEGLTGGVHNAFPTNDYAYALSAGEKFVILDVRDIANPRYVGEYRHPGGRIHDVHVHDGIAYASQWQDGVVVVDVGNGRWGGSPSNPVFVLNVTTPGGATHTAFPYRSQSTDRFYVVAGDEILPRPGRAWGEGIAFEVGIDPYDPETGEGGLPAVSAGYYHIIDFTDFENPRIVAKYEVPEFGTHNYWIVDDILYTAYYEGGVRVVDMSGELMGNLATQDREIAVFKPFDPAGFIANAPMVWTAHPHAGRIFFSDWNSGLWAVEVDGLVSPDHCHRADQDHRCDPEPPQAAAPEM